MALRRWDTVRLVAFDENWFADATVSYADRAQVIFCGFKKTDMPKREVALFEDETYRIDWAGSGYGVFRKSDGLMMNGVTYQSGDAAKDHIVKHLYPRKVA
ncbi:MAG TPA: hypothetical protein VMX97_14925 [Hyphomicrobiaceae bacterium]|nr:hypothetical protein [Hyphomicrobiaceae bacterium]